jgi:hypothetical protein
MLCTAGLQLGLSGKSFITSFTCPGFDAAYFARIGL